MSSQTTEAPGGLDSNTGAAEVMGHDHDEDTTTDDYEAQVAEADYKDELFSVWGCL